MDNFVESGVVNVHLADHDLIFCNVSANLLPKESIYKTKGCFKNFNQDLFFYIITNAPFHAIFRINDIDNKVLYFTEILKQLNIHIPLTIFKVMKTPFPWLTNNLRFIMSLRDRVLTKYHHKKLLSH